MRFAFRAMLQGALLAVGIGLWGGSPLCEAQKIAPAPVRATIPVEVKIPGKGLVRGRLRLLPPGAMRPRGNSRTPFSISDPIVFSSLSDYDGDAVYGDSLWSFPTLGYDPGSIGLPGYVPNTLEGGIPGAPTPPADANTAEVYYGQLGTQARLTGISMYGGMVNINTLEYAPGVIAIVFFDGVDAATPPQPNGAQAGFNIALTEQGDLGYAVLVPDPGALGSIGLYDVDFDADNRMPLSNAQGKFGVMVAKYYNSGVSSPGDVQWVGLTNSPNGPNRVYNLSDIHVTAAGATATITPRSQPADDTFNQSIFGSVNYFYELRGNRFNNDPTPIPRGTLQGNIRRRGFNIPDPLTPESVPGFYRVAAFNASNQLVREDFVFSQPSYDSFGELTVNYKLEGYPVGTFTIEVSQLPILNELGEDNIQWDTALYPFSDSLPARQAVTVTDISELPFEPTVLNVRLERFGDIDNANGTGTRDGAVDVFDLAALVASFNKVVGDPGYLAAADIAGDPSVNQGRPDGAVDVFDLAALIQVFNTGAEEAP